MTFKFKGNEYHFPESLSEIKLRQRIGFYNEHGKQLDERLPAINEITDSFERETAITEWHLDNAARSLSFYAGIPLDDIRKNVSVDDLVYFNNAAVHPLLQQEQEIQLRHDYEFNGEKWELTAPELLPESKMTFNEFLHAKEIVRTMHAAGKGKWESMPYLCAIYLRHPGEKFAEDMVYADSQRLALMQELPLDIAIAVGFFLTGTLSIYSTTSASSRKENPEESQPEDTSTNGAG